MKTRRHSDWGLCRFFLPVSLLPVLVFSVPATTRPQSTGLFEGSGDVGKVSHPGSAAFDPATSSYLVRGGGENMWFGTDAFHFVWKRVSGDFALRSAISFVGSGGNAHRKACLIVRQSLSPDSPYVDVAVHGDGLTSLQFRDTAGANTSEIQANLSRPPEVGIERQGETFFMTVGSAGGPQQPAGPFIRVRFADPVYVGLAVCSHDDKVIEAARFSKVELKAKDSQTGAKPILHSTLEIVPVASGDRRAIYHTLDHIEAPNWSRDGGHLIFNSGGKIYRLPVAGGKPELIDTGFATRCNNDHGLSPDGTQLAISDQSRGGKSLIYILPATGGTPRQVTQLGPSYWHGWSPDGKTLTYCAERGGEYDVYTIPVEGGEERRLTSATGLDDGPEYTPDGRFIYFNSVRTGLMQIWRMKPDGTGQEQVTSDDYNNWFAHPSPDGKWIVFLSFEKDVTGHPPNKNVRLRMMPIGGGPIKELAKLFGGQGTINVPSWSPDSQRIAFVSYELLVR
jgi:TolB protein